MSGAKPELGNSLGGGGLIWLLLGGDRLLMMRVLWMVSLLGSRRAWRWWFHRGGYDIFSGLFQRYRLEIKSVLQRPVVLPHGSRR